jgi:hypothetical protein
VEQRWGEGGAPGGRRRERERDVEQRWEGSVSLIGVRLTCGPTSGWLGWRRNMKDDECGRCKYKGENMSEWNGIFRFEGEDKGERVWIV